MFVIPAIPHSSPERIARIPYRVSGTQVGSAALGAGVGLGVGYGANYLLNRSYPDSWVPAALLPAIGALGGGYAGYHIKKNIDKLNCLRAIHNIADLVLNI